MAITGTEIVNFWSNAVLPQLKDLIQTPLTNPDILWTILPLLGIAFSLELYFGRYKTEELGWNTAFGNTISLLWVTTALFRFMYETHGSVIFREWNFAGNTPTMLLIYALGLWSLLLAISNFFHILPKQISFFVSSTIPVNVSAVITTVLVIGQFQIDRVTLTAALILYITLAIIFATIQALVVPSAEAKKYIQEYKKKAEEKKKERENNFYHHVDLIKERIKAQYHATIATIRGFFHSKKQEKKK